MAATTTTPAQLNALAQMVAVGGSFHTPTLQLFQNDVLPTPSSILSDLTLATFPGYADVTALTWGAAYIAADGTVHITAPSQQFDCTGSATPNIIYGYMIVDAGITTLYGAERLPVPVSMNANHDAVIVLPDIVYGG